MTYCRDKFKESDWLYCTKFGTSSDNWMHIEIKGKFVAIYKTGQDDTYVDVAIYKDDVWEDIVESKMTCN